MIVVVLINWLLKKLDDVEFYAIEETSGFVLIVFFHKNKTLVFSVERTNDGANLRCSEIVDGKTTASSNARQILNTLSDGFEDFCNESAKKKAEFDSILRKSNKATTVADLLKPSQN